MINFVTQVHSYCPFSLERKADVLRAHGSCSASEAISFWGLAVEVYRSLGGSESERT